ncbi:MAG: response regulator [Lachnospiraceae bacterium]|nr:response regulator [Candidatus Equihabitans merdae]
MPKIAICDGSPEELKKTTELVNDYINDRHVSDVDLVTFSTSFELLDKIENGEFYDILILETSLTGITGIQVARQVRKLKQDPVIIYYTDTKEYAFEAFEMGATQYLLKSTAKEQFFEVMDRVCDFSYKERRRKILLVTKEGLVNLYMRDIMYTESSRNYQLLTMSNGEVHTARVTGKNLAAALEKNIAFVRCGSSYILNIFYIHTVNAHEVTMTDGRVIPIPRGHFKTIKEACVRFSEHIAAR